MKKEIRDIPNEIKEGLQESIDFVKGETITKGSGSVWKDLGYKLEEAIAELLSNKGVTSPNEVASEILREVSIYASDDGDDSTSL